MISVGSGRDVGTLEWIVVTDSKWLWWSFGNYFGLDVILKQRIEGGVVDDKILSCIKLVLLSQLEMMCSGTCPWLRS